MGKFTNYDSYVGEQADFLFSENKNLFNDEVKDGSVDVYEFFDNALHEWADNDFIYVDLRDAADIIEQSDNVESDWGLWEGQAPMEAIKTQAFFTYRSDLWYVLKDIVYGYLEDLEEKAEGDIEDLQNEYDGLNDKLADLEAEEGSEAVELEIDELQGDIDTTGDKLSKAEDFLSNIKDTMESI